MPACAMVVLFSCVTFINNYDGDTITVSFPSLPTVFGEKLPVRIRGIDTPERKGGNVCSRKKALDAKNLVHSWLANNECIKLTNVGRDKYFRLLADVSNGAGEDIAKKLLSLKLAVPYDGGTKKQVDWCNIKK